MEVSGLKRFEISENGINMVLELNDRDQVKLVHFTALPFNEKDIKFTEGSDPFPIVELQVSGVDRTGERHGSKYVRTGPGYRLQYKELKDEQNKTGRKLEVITADNATGLEVHSHYQFYHGIPVVRAWTDVVNLGKEDCGLEYVSSFSLTGIDKEGILPSDEKLELKIPHNAWQKELHWNTYSMKDLGMSITQTGHVRRSSKTIGIGNVGNWSTKEYLPMGYLRNRETNSNLFWQIENNGSWYWEISDQDGYFYLKLSGPTEHQSHWWKNLRPGESFTTVPVCVGSTIGNFDDAMDELTKYRRTIRRDNQDNKKLGVIFNDYMNCLWGDPTTAKEIPLIDKAHEVGCEYYCIDCGWYSKGYWWDSVGEWKPSKERFPNGIEEVINYIRSKGMVPGLWLELEVMGIQCPKASRVPEDWYFARHGKKVTDRSRYQLDFRNPEVRTFATGVIDRLVNEYGIGYIKMDYNIEPGIGTEHNADSFGDGLLGHNRAYLSWLDSIFRKYPDLIIENCSSGGLRMDYAMLSRYSIQSTSDQEDFKKYATIATNCPSALTPEQAAIWSYTLANSSEEEVIFNMVNAMMLRIHQSGQLMDLSPEKLSLVKEGISCYKSIREDIKKSVPFWPLGLSHYSDQWVCLGLKTEHKDYVAVWRRDSPASTVCLPVPQLKGQEVAVSCLYPQMENCRYTWNRDAGNLSIDITSRVGARLFVLKH